MNTSRISLFLVCVLCGCAIQGKRDEDRDRPVIDGKARDYVEIRSPDDPAPNMPPVGFLIEEKEEATKGGRKTKSFIYKIRLQLRCQGGLVEAPLRGKMLTWNWEGVVKSQTVSDTEGFVSLMHKSANPIPLRSLTWSLASQKGVINLNKGPYLLVMEGTDCH